MEVQGKNMYVHSNFDVIKKKEFFRFTLLCVQKKARIFVAHICILLFYYKQKSRHYDDNIRDNVTHMSLLPLNQSDDVLYKYG